MTFDFYDRMANCQSLDDVKAAMVKHFAMLGYDFLTVWSLPPPGSPVSGILLNTRPEDYVQRYVEQDYVEIDPVVTFMRRTMRTFAWSDVRQSMKLSKAETRILDEGQEFGFNEGLTIPIVTAVGSLAVVSPCGRNPDTTDRARSAATMMSIIGHEALKRLQFNDPVAQRAYEPLTTREREVMRWVAVGKTDGEIADILNVSSHTITAHVERAKEKLGTGKRLVAAIIALQHGEIML